MCAENASVKNVRKVKESQTPSWGDDCASKECEEKIRWCEKNLVIVERLLMLIVRARLVETRNVCESPQVQLERLEAAADSVADRTFPPATLLSNHDIDARLAKTANALRARIRLLQRRQAVADCTINLHGLLRVRRRRVIEAAAAHVINVRALTALDRGKRLARLLCVRGRCQGLLEGRCLVAVVLVLVECMVRQRRQRRAVDRHGRLGNWRSVVFEVFSSGRGSIEKLVPPCARVIAAGFRRHGLNRAAGPQTVNSFVSAPIGIRALRLLLLMVCSPASLSDRLLSSTARTNLLEWRQRSRAARRRSRVDRGKKLAVAVLVRESLDGHVMVRDAVDGGQLDRRLRHTNLAVGSPASFITLQLGECNCSSCWSGQELVRVSRHGSRLVGACLVEVGF